jgi:hypothetical protein
MLGLSDHPEVINLSCCPRPYLECALLVCLREWLLIGPARILGDALDAVLSLLPPFLSSLWNAEGLPSSLRAVFLDHSDVQKLLPIWPELVAVLTAGFRWWLPTRPADSPKRPFLSR